MFDIEKLNRSKVCIICWNANICLVLDHRFSGSVLYLSLFQIRSVLLQHALHCSFSLFRRKSKPDLQTTFSDSKQIKSKPEVTDTGEIKQNTQVLSKVKI